ncbi:metal-binding protein [Kitasatospora sp. NPDC127116]|uniref:metal-binding protein n=1 Tax=Kitasatospora sp. NPDC127116 TaxID=3345367 RepID=UPI003629F9D2
MAATGTPAPAPAPALAPAPTVGTAPVPSRRYTLTGPDNRPYSSTTPGTLGGHRRGRRYGRLDCPSALRAIAAGGYVRHRVFFADEATAIAAAYRPCSVCLPGRYREWKTRQKDRTP